MTRAAGGDVGAGGGDRPTGSSVASPGQLPLVSPSATPTWTGTTGRAGGVARGSLFPSPAVPEKRAVLRITRLAHSESVQTLQLEGKLLEPWVDEVRQACAPSGGHSRLDLSAVTFVDAAGVELLRELIRQGIEIAAYSGYVAELLYGGEP